MRIIFLIVVCLHGLIHLLGFAKAFNLASLNQLSEHISEANGVLWLTSAVLFLSSGLLISLKKDTWWMLALIPIILSQYLIVTSWHDAKFGTVANAIILIAATIGFGVWNFNRIYRNEKNEALKFTPVNTSELLTETDIQHLPNPVKKYLRYTDAVGKPKVKDFKVEFSGDFRQSDKSGWMPFTSEQYNFMYEPTRLFFMKATMKHLPVVGFHCFKHGNASMDIRLLSLFKVQYQAGEQMNISETVTFFNDMCVMAPSTLIDPRIRWIHAAADTVEAEFTNQNITISAILYFNQIGELVNFVSKDRFAVTEGDNLINAPWSTPLSAYKEINGYKLASYGETIYSFPKGDFCYGKFKLNKIRYNVQESTNRQR